MTFWLPCLPIEWLMAMIFLRLIMAWKYHTCLLPEWLLLPCLWAGNYISFPAALSIGRLDLDKFTNVGQWVTPCQLNQPTYLARTLNILACFTWTMTLCWNALDASLVPSSFKSNLRCQNVWRSRLFIFRRPHPLHSWNYEWLRTNVLMSAS